MTPAFDQGYPGPKKGPALKNCLHDGTFLALVEAQMLVNEREDQAADRRPRAWMIRKELEKS